MDIKDIPYDDIKEFLFSYDKISISVEKNYQVVKDLITNNNFDNVPDSIKYWIAATKLHNIPIYKLSQFYNLTKKKLINN